MKKQILHLVIFLLMGANVSANPFASTLNISMAGNAVMMVVFDGVSYPNSAYDFRMENITPGNHHVKIITRENRGWRNLPLNRVVFNGWINLNPGEEVFATIDRFSRLKINRVVKSCPPPPVNYWDYHNDNCNSYRYYSPMPPESFIALKQTILNCNFESSRLECAKMALAHNYFTSQQIADIMNLFWFESSKLEFAKSAYSHVIDSQNYYQVYNQFSFNSSIKELNQCLGIRR